MEKHYVFKSLFEDINQVSSVGGKAHLCTLSDIVHSAHIFRCSYSSRATRRLLLDNGCSSPILRNPIQYCLACRNLSIPPDVKMSSKNTPRYSSGIIVLKKNLSTANARCSSDQRCMMTEGFKPLYPAMCVSPCHFQRCRHGAKFKSSNCFCPTLYNISLVYDHCYPRPLKYSVLYLVCYVQLHIVSTDSVVCIPRVNIICIVT